jgi:hypothetical protein
MIKTETKFAVVVESQSADSFIKNGGSYHRSVTYKRPMLASSWNRETRMYEVPASDEGLDDEGFEIRDRD